MVTDVYTRQCSVNVSAKDLAMMAATLANGGTQPGHEEAGRSPPSTCPTSSR